MLRQALRMYQMSQPVPQQSNWQYCLSPQPELMFRMSHHENPSHTSQNPSTEIRLQLPAS